MKFKVEDSLLFKSIFRSITRFTDVARFDIQKNGIRIRSIDPHDFCYVDIHLSPSFFDSFGWNSEKLSAGAEIGKFRYMLSAITKEKPLHLEINPKALAIDLINKHTTKYTLDWIDDDGFDLPEPLKYKYDTSITIPSDRFFEIIKEASTVSREVCFLVDDGKLKAVASDENYSYTTALELDDKTVKTEGLRRKKQIRTCAIIDYLRTLSEIIRMCDEVTLNLSDELPLKVDLSYRGKGSFTFIIANRKLTSQQEGKRKQLQVKENSPILQTPSLPHISVTKFPEFMKEIGADEKISFEDLKHSKYETPNGDYAEIAQMLNFIKKTKSNFVITDTGKYFAKEFEKDSRSITKKLHEHVQKMIPEYDTMIEHVNNGPISAEELAKKIRFGNNTDSKNKKQKVLLLLGIATWCNAIDRKLGLYYFGKN